MPIMKKRTSTRKSKTAKGKRKPLTKSRSRQFYSEIGTKKAGAGTTTKKPTSGKITATVKVRSGGKRSAAPTRELLSEISKVGRKIKRRVRRAL